MADVKLSDEAKGVLRRAEFKQRVCPFLVKLPEGKIPDKVYREIDKVFKNAGGKWSRSQQGHVFETDPHPLLREALAGGKSIDQRKKFQSFFTVPHVAHRMAAMAGVEGKTVLEPSAGKGAIAGACQAAGAFKVTCVEIQPEFVSVLRSQGFDTAEANFLAPGFINTIGKHFDCVVMNPPFTKNQDAQHIAKALEYLKVGGTLVSLVAGNLDRKPLQKVFGLYEVDDLVELPAGTFKESGTNIATYIVKIKKHA